MEEAVAALILTRPLYEQMLSHARETAPMEAVGLLGGHPSGRVMIVLPLANLAGPGKFLADPLAQFQAERALQKEGLIIVAIYHSHPGGGSELSDVDRSLSFNRPVAHVVIAVARPNELNDDVRAYHVRNSMLTSVDICLD